MIERTPAKIVLLTRDRPPLTATVEPLDPDAAFTVEPEPGGAGLGLAICAKIAEVHGATLSFLSRNDGRAGLVVEIDFPS